MRFPAPLLPGVLLKRYKRFLADMRLADGTLITAHCPNPGAMSGCAEPGFPVLVSLSGKAGRKLPHTWELVHNGKCWIGVNTGLANAVVEEALRNRRIPGLEDWPEIRREVAYGEGSRVDFLLSGPRGLAYLEVKSVTLVGADGRYAFPDAVTERGLRHLRELERMVASGHKAAVLFLIQRSDGTGFRAAAEIDPDYARGLERAHRAGVEVLPFLTEVTPQGISLSGPHPFLSGSTAL